MTYKKLSVKKSKKFDLQKYLKNYVIRGKMNKYKVEITETLQKTIEVEADNKEDAMHKVMKMYKNSEVILDDNDFVNLDFNNV